jgi:hypothetical protein
MNIRNGVIHFISMHTLSFSLFRIKAEQVTFDWVPLLSLSNSSLWLERLRSGRLKKEEVGSSVLAKDILREPKEPRAAWWTFWQLLTWWLCHSGYRITWCFFHHELHREATGGWTDAQRCLHAQALHMLVPAQPALCSSLLLDRTSPLAEWASCSGPKVMVETHPRFDTWQCWRYWWRARTTNYSSELNKHAMTFDTRLKTSNSRRSC